MLEIVGEDSTSAIVTSLTHGESEMTPPTTPTHHVQTNTHIDTFASADIAQDVYEEDVSKKTRLEPTESVPSTRKKSKVWGQFVKLPLEETNGGIKAGCKYCPKVYSCDPNKHGNSFLIRHMKMCLS